MARVGTLASRLVEWIAQSPEGQFVAGAVPLALAAVQALRPGSPVPAMPWPAPPMTLAQARAQIAAVAARQQPRADQALREQAESMARRGLYGASGAGAVASEVLARTEPVAAAQQAAMAGELWRRDLDRYLQGLSSVSDYMIRRARLSAQAREAARRALWDLIGQGVELYRDVAERTFVYPFTRRLAASAERAAAGRWIDEQGRM